MRITFCFDHKNHVFFNLPIPFIPCQLDGRCTVDQGLGSGRNFNIDYKGRMFQVLKRKFKQAIQITFVPARDYFVKDRFVEFFFCRSDGPIYSSVKLCRLCGVDGAGYIHVPYDYCNCCAKQNAQVELTAPQCHLLPIQVLALHAAWLRS